MENERYMIEATKLGKRYGSSDAWAVDALSLSVAAGEVYGLLGANGSGKSTTVGMLATLVQPTRGSARVAGHDVVGAAAQVRRRIGVTLQEAGVDPTATPRELLRLHGRLLGLDERAARHRAQQLLDTFDLGEKADARIKTLSGGNRRRVDLALALVGEPAVLFLDEPTTGLDPLSRQTVWDQVERLRDAGTAVLLTTQYLEEADRLADRVGILATGRLRVEGTPEELKRSVGGDVLTVEVDPEAESEAARILDARGEGAGRLTLRADDGGAAVPRALAALAERDIVPRAVTLTRPSLDDVFRQVADSRLSEQAETEPQLRGVAA